MNTKHTLLPLLLLFFCCKNLSGQTLIGKTDLTLTIQTLDAATKKPVTNVRITVQRDDSLRVTFINDAEGKVVLKAKTGSIFQAGCNYKISLEYPSPVSILNSLYAKEFAFKISTTEVPLNEIYYSKNLDPDIDFSKYILPFKPRLLDVTDSANTVLNEVCNVLKNYPNFEITLIYNETGDKTGHALRFERLEKLTELLTKKGLNIRRITTNLKYIGCCESYKDDVCEIAISGYSFR